MGTLEGILGSPNLYILTGPPGAGKTSVSDVVERLLGNAVEVMEAATERPRRALELGKPYGGGVASKHKFLSPDEMDKQISESKKPLTWRMEGHRYCVDYADIESSLANGKNVILNTLFFYGSSKLLEAHPLAYVISLIATEQTTINRMKRQGRTAEEIMRREIAPGYRAVYEDIGQLKGSVLLNDDLYTGVHVSEKLTGTRVARIIQWARTHPLPEALEADFARMRAEEVQNYVLGTPAVRIHAEYAKALERAISGNGKPLHENQIIHLPDRAVAECGLSTLQNWNLRIQGIVDDTGVRSINLWPERLKRGARLRDFRHLLSFSLAQKGFWTADDYGSNPTRYLSHPRTTELRYQLTDKTPAGPFWDRQSDRYAVKLVMGR